MKLVTVKQMQAIEHEADTKGLTYERMMANAGQGLAQIIGKIILPDEKPVVIGLIGSGNNGGDTLIALSHLAQRGFQTCAYLIKRKQDELVTTYNRAGGVVISASEDPSYEKLATSIGQSDILLDGVLGTGFSLPLKPEIARILTQVKAIIADDQDPPLVIAVDCPSGVDCDTGESAPETIQADMTVTMAAVKQGMLILPAYNLLGELHHVDIGLPDAIKSFNLIDIEVADPEMVKRSLPNRPADAHKGTFGTAVIAAGSTNYTGAALLAGKAAYRSGAGLVTLAVPAPVHLAIAGHFPEATWILLPHQQGVIAREAADILLKSLERCTALLIGPGLGLEDTSKDFIENVLSGKPIGPKATTRIGFVHSEPADANNKSNELPPMVFDADALKHLAKITDWRHRLPAPAILTPHPGEMSVLTGLSKEDLQENRLEIARKYSQEWGHVVVLKGAFTVVASPDGRTTIIPVATAALARAGSGDVLAGLIVGLLAQGMEAYPAAVAGAWIHGRAGLFTADELSGTTSVLAGDLIDAIPEVLSSL